MSYKDMTEIQKLRHLAAISGDCRESVWDGMTRAEILAVCDAWMSCGWDFYPHEWTRAQLTDAIRYGIVPTWVPVTDRPLTYELPRPALRDLIDENRVARLERECMPVTR